jgi:predicted acyl esterase
MRFGKFFAVLVLVLSSTGLLAYGKATHMPQMRDGINLATDVYLPDTDDSPWPTVLIRTPYDKDNIGSDDVSLFTDQNGYALVVQNTRGRYDSEGIDSVFMDDAWGEEKRDGYDCVEWVAEQSWCDAKIGTFGASADGITQYMMAGAAPPHLICQFVMVAVPSLYHYAVFPGGEFRKHDIQMWLLLQQASYMLSLFDEHPRYDTAWERINLAERWDSVVVPIYHFAGWYDLFLEGNLDAYSNLQVSGGEGARGNQKLLVGPWTHGTLGDNDPGDLFYPSNASFDYMEESLRWFDYWLKGAKNGIMVEPRVKYYQMGDPASGVTEVENTWLEADIWPLPSEELHLYLYKDGSLDSVPPQVESANRRYDYDPRIPVQTVGGRNLFLDAGPMDQRGIEVMPGIITYTSEELAEPLVVAGKITAHLWASSDRTDTDWSVRITDVYPDGRSMLVGDGILRARYHSSAPLFDSEELLIPDSIYEFEVDLWSSAITFAEGHRIRVAVASSNYRRFESNPNTGAAFKRDDEETLIAENRIYSDADHPSYISLPLPVEEPSAITEDTKPVLAPYALKILDRTVSFSISQSGYASLELFDACGRKVAALYEGSVASGTHAVALPVLHSGVYFVRFEFGNSSLTAKFVEVY